jgi:hypothetical protein
MFPFVNIQDGEVHMAGRSGNPKQDSSSKGAHTKASKGKAHGARAHQDRDSEREQEQASESESTAPSASSESSHEAETLFSSEGGGTASSSDENQGTADEVKLDFPYSELVRSYAPKAMEVADKVANDWKKDGSFMNLGIENPYANMAVAVGLKKAKDLEKKLDEKGVLSIVRMGVEVLKQQVNRRK